MCEQPLASRKASSDFAAEAAPLSFQQEGLWFLDQMAGGGAPYNIHSASRHRGPLDAELLERSLRS